VKVDIRIRSLEPTPHAYSVLCFTVFHYANGKVLSSYLTMETLSASIMMELASTTMRSPSTFPPDPIQSEEFWMKQLNMTDDFFDLIMDDGSQAVTETGVSHFCAESVFVLGQSYKVSYL
jgi:hypothetical protein